MTATRFKVAERTGIIGTAVKENADVLRVMCDFSSWLDMGEQVGSITNFMVEVATLTPETTWQADFPILPSPDGVDTYPLAVTSAVIAAAGTRADILLGGGTPGLIYVVSFVALGTVSGRLKEVDFLVSLSATVNDKMITSLTPAVNTVTIVVATTILPVGTTGSVFLKNAAAAAISVTLPAAPVLCQELDFKDVAGNARTYTITVQTSDGSLIDDSVTFIIGHAYQAVSFVWSGTQWSVQ